MLWLVKGSGWEFLVSDWWKYITSFSSHNATFLSSLPFPSPRAVYIFSSAYLPFLSPPSPAALSFFFFFLVCTEQIIENIQNFSEMFYNPDSWPNQFWLFLIRTKEDQFSKAESINRANLYGVP